MQQQLTACCISHGSTNYHYSLSTRKIVQHRITPHHRRQQQPISTSQIHFNSTEWTSITPRIFLLALLQPRTLSLTLMLTNYIMTILSFLPCHPIYSAVIHPTGSHHYSKWKKGQPNKRIPGAHICTSVLNAILFRWIRVICSHVTVLLVRCIRSMFRIFSICVIGFTCLLVCVFTTGFIRSFLWIMWQPNKSWLDSFQSRWVWPQLPPCTTTDIRV